MDAEPMDLDDDSRGYSPRSSHSAYQRGTYPGSNSAPCFSPFPPPYIKPATQPMRGHFDQLSGPSTSTPVFGRSCHSSQSLFKTDMHSGIFGTGMHGSSFTTPASTQRSLTREGTQVQASLLQRGLEYLRSDDTSHASMDASDRSDVSEMEVVQTSPTTSPSWDKVRAALGNFSLFKNEARREEKDAQTPSVADKENEAKSVRESSRRPGASWEPSLSAVQAATTFKRSQRHTKSSPAKSESSTVQTSTPMRKLGIKETDGGDTNTASIAKRQLKLKAALSEPDKSGCCSFGCCLKVSALLLAIVSVVIAVALQQHVAVSRDNFANMDAELLRDEMASKVFGQHIAMNVVPQSIEQYLHELRAGNASCKDDSCFFPPLVLFFNGWTGVGKNFISDIVTSLFSARTVKKFLVPYHFPHEHLDKQYQKNIENWVLSNVTKYTVNFFIFDEMDKAFPGVIQGIKNAITQLSHQNSYNSPSVFLLLSNSFGSDINHKVFQAMREGQDRESLSMDDFANLFSEDEDTIDSWFQQIKSSSARTVAVPFLPLEKQHIVQCIRRDLVWKKLSTHADIVSRVLEELTFVTLPGGRQFSQTGCKRVSDKVNLVAFD
ncbi:torsin-4A-like [Littorina saxatilis]